ncbi:ADP-dependent glucokinase/phosphofructokinase [Labilibaculum sp.]|uniref:ADP-dependent glucokinase/phosphofructokinase n=1 Tax=Labilibaculum sp. TaxID=2060723 RepID=UPI002AA6B2EA|nr:ADP-dependent glucokinase/phosphofructokinase [Labilibaculum sp.]
MSLIELKTKWLENYKTAPAQLEKMGDINGLISAFNANVDAVIKVKGKGIQKLIAENKLNTDLILGEGENSIRSNEDAIRGFLNCFKNGIAEEWLIEDVEVFEWLNKNVGYDKMQMGGQGGIVANVMAVCGVNSVYVHCASAPKDQSKLFLDLPNLLTNDENGEIKQASKVDRSNDLALIHWIIEFDKGDSISLNGETYVCPKANRFIATYDPLNFKLHIDGNFANRMSQNDINPEYIILSGYQMLHESLRDGTKGTDRIDFSKAMIAKWRESCPDSLLHLEVASTQNKVIRKYLIDNLVDCVDSLGFNERELIDILEVIGEDELAKKCEENTNSSNLFEGMLKIREYTNCSRMQLHMFGLYLTLQEKGFKVSPLQNRNGMQLAATVAAAKAGTGAIDNKDVLLWAKDHEVSEVGLNELSNLSEFVTKLFGNHQLMETGIFTNEELEIIAVPTILIEKPVTLVGMGDTISSVSLVGAR